MHPAGAKMRRFAGCRWQRRRPYMKVWVSLSHGTATATGDWTSTNVSTELSQSLLMSMALADLRALRS